MDQIIGIKSHGFPEITTVFQPIVDLTGKPIAHEALLRGADGSCACQVLEKIDPWDLSAFCFLCRKTAIDNAVKQGFNGVLSLNFLPQTLGTPFTIQRTLAYALEAGLPPPIFELLEHEPIRCPTEANLCFSQVRRAGAKVFIDDYGTGYNSHMSLLADLQIDGVKLSLDVVRNVARLPRWRNVMSSFVQMAHSQGIMIVAEGIESDVERTALSAIGADYFQGYHIARPAAQIGNYGDLMQGCGKPDVHRCACVG